MRKVVTKYLCIYMALAMLVTVIAIFGFQTIVSMKDNTQIGYDRLEALKERMQSNDEAVKQLTDTLGQSSLAKARAFAFMVKQKPELLQSVSELQKICDLLMVDEIHYINTEGVLQYGSISEYFGMDFATNDQTKPFLEILKDPNLEIVQEPQPNAASQQLFQYIGVSVKDGTGFVQVGVRQEVLEEKLKSTAVDKALGDFKVGNTGYAFVIDLDTKNILAHPNAELIGTPSGDAGFTEKMLAGGKGKATIDKTSGYYTAEIYDDMLIGTMLPASEYNAARTSQTLVVSASMFIIFLALIFLINGLVNRKIVKGVHRISEKLKNIADGDLDTVVTENGNREFKMLSDSINAMVSNIRNNLEKNESLLEKQKEDVEKSNALMRSIKVVCENIDHVSQETLSISQSLNTGSTEQEEAVEGLHMIMNRLTEKLKESAQTSIEISGNTNRSVENMIRTKDNMNSLSDSIEEIANASIKIENIISKIDAIATQTNMLSLNASIEAARAGEAGKGFAVVAGQVGELAARSTQAAKETTDLITSSIEAVNRGKEITEETVQEFLKVVQDIESAGREVEQVASMANEQVTVVLDAVESLNLIYSVVEKNSVISENSEVTSESLANEASKLREMVENK